MDVHYKPDDWQKMKDGIDILTKDALMELRDANDLLEKIETKIRSLDLDRSIQFEHRSKNGKINELLDDYTTLGIYCTDVGQAVSRHIDEPFYKDMDKFAGKMRDLSIRNYSTENRIGSTTTTTMPNAHGYGTMQTVTTKKDKITVDDIFKDSVAFDKVLRAQYKEMKKQHPDAKLDYAEYRKLVPSMRGFEYTTIEDEQKKLEAWRDLGISAGILILSIACPPAGLTASVLYSGLQLKSAYEGKDWGTGRKLSDAERAGNAVFGALDAIPLVGTAAKGIDSIASISKLSKMQDAGKVFNPNTTKHVVQSLQDSKKLTLDRLKLASLKVEKTGNSKMYQLGEKLAKSIDNRTAKSQNYEIDGNGVMTAKQGGTDFYGWVNKHHTESNRVIDEKIKSVEASLAKGTGENKFKLGKTDLDAYRNELNVPETNTVSVGKADVSGLENTVFKGASPEVRNQAKLPSLDDVNPNREFKAPYDHIKNPRLAQFTRHAEEGVLNEFNDAVKKAGIDPNDVKGTLYIHQSNPRGVCNKCTKGLIKPFPEDKCGIFYQASKKFPNLKIVVTSELDETVKVNGLLSFTLKDGKILE